MKCKLVAMLEEKIHGLEGQVQTSQRIREAEEFSDHQIWEASPSQIQKRKEGTGHQRTKESGNREEAWQNMLGISKNYR